jgi:hypothetical protein
MMMVMPANNTGAWVGYLAGRYEGAMGHLYSPGAQTGPFPFLPYALDNGAFGAFKNGTQWDVHAWRGLLGWSQMSGQRPLWALVPDVVGDKAGTLDAWHRHAGEVISSGMRPAFAVQDGMLPEDVPDEADVIFIGGSTEWKWATAGMWCAAFPHVHIGRVNTLRWLRVAAAHGAKSVDGTGWFRGDKAQRDGLRQFLAEQAGEITEPQQLRLFAALSDDKDTP